MFQKAYQPRQRVISHIRPETGRTHQSFKDECDINLIVNHWLKTGAMPAFNQRQPIYSDVSEIPTYSEAQQLMTEASQLFEQLPPEEQEKFEGPLEYLESLLVEEETGHNDPLDVIVPTDSQISQKGGTDEITQENVSPEQS